MANASLSGKAAIVTGGSRGNGAGIALELARHGAKVTEEVITSQPSSRLPSRSLLQAVKLQQMS